MFALQPDLRAVDIPSFSLEKLGNNLCSQLFDIYIDLPIWSSVTSLNNHLSKLLSSSHISPELLDAVQHVSESLTQLDIRPSRRKRGNLSAALERFKKITITDLLNSVALINSFVNDVAKYATNPKAYASRSISFDERSPLSQTSGSDK